MNKLTSIGIIMDGNRRYAKKKKISNEEAYNIGGKKAFSIITHIKTKYTNIKQIYLYTLAKKNLLRPKYELQELENVFLKNINNFDKLYDNKINLKFIGDYSKLSKKTISKLDDLNNKLPSAKLTVYFALGYDGRQEIIDAINNIIKDKKSKITETTFRKYLYDKNMIDPEIIIRTSGTNRLSSFLQFQSAFSELFFIKKYWPEITNKDIDTIFKKYKDIQRNFGK